jgi:hypothetical protein
MSFRILVQCRDIRISKIYRHRTQSFGIVYNMSYLLLLGALATFQPRRRVPPPGPRPAWTACTFARLSSRPFQQLLWPFNQLLGNLWSFNQSGSRIQYGYKLYPAFALSVAKNAGRVATNAVAWLSYNPFSKPDENDVLNSERPHSFGRTKPHHFRAPSRTSSNTSKSINLKRSKFGLSVLKFCFQNAYALLRQNERSNMDTRVSELDCMDFFGEWTLMHHK